MTLLEIETELARETNQNPSSLSTTTKARYLAAINRHYRRLVSMPGLQHLRDTTTTFASVAGQAKYQISAVAKVKRVVDRTNRIELQPMSMAQYRMLEQAPTLNSGTSTFWIWDSMSGSSTQTFDVFLWQTPAAVLTYHIDITSVLTPLSADGDVPILPFDFQDLLFLGALMDEYRHLDDSRLTVAERAYRERDGQFRYWMHETDAGSLQVSYRRRLPSQLGSQFPAGS